MKLLALLLGLLIEKVSTSLFGLREMRWLDHYFDFGFKLLPESPVWMRYMLVASQIAVLVLPVATVAYYLHVNTRDILYLIVSVIVLFFSLGPRDLSAEVHEFVEATEANDEERRRRVAKELLEFDPPSDPQETGLSVASAVFVQSNNRTFGVILWFVLLGPVGAWAFRVSDMLRRRAIFENGRRTHQNIQEVNTQGADIQDTDRPNLDDQNDAGFLQPVQNVHGVLSWLPSRLAAMSFALAGSFEPATTAWKDYYQTCSEQFFEVNDDIVACAGCGALGEPTRDAMRTQPESGAMGALSLVHRSMVVWLVIVALLTIAGAAI